ncbi:ATP-binding protein [Gorillibacterium massiliense]|uniref:ATP-binding protein n=1 Tax=Gorillibacterium massiliense TaxID=1280390 RepID=UPI0004B0B21A|nr:ATP-binding protein [Gorillibacterium massiliense]
MTRDLSKELDELKQQMADLQQLVRHFMPERKGSAAVSHPVTSRHEPTTEPGDEADVANSVFYSGRMQVNGLGLRLEPQERRMEQLLGLNGEKAAKVLAALGHKQRLDILRAVLQEPLTGAELVDRLNMGTTGQLYHHLKALQGADLLVQEHGGRYTLPRHRLLPFLLLLAAAGDLLDASDYLAMQETRDQAGTYFSAAADLDVHHLLWAVVENSILEHQEGYCSEVGIFLHGDGSVTVADNGRGIPAQLLPGTNLSNVQSVLTDIGRFSSAAPYQVPGAEKGITIAIANALSQKLTVEVRRDGKIYRQEYRRGIPQTDLLTVGISSETGTRITFTPDSDLFGAGLERTKLEERIEELREAYPRLAIAVFD